MNIIFRTMETILSRFNNFVDNLDKRYLDMIRQISIFLVASLWITGLVLGYTRGRSAAKKTGITIIESTNDVLSIDVNLAKEDNVFGDVLKEELETETSRPDFAKEKLPESPDLKMELKTEIFESDFDKKENKGPEPIITDKVSEVPLMDKTSRETDDSGIIEKSETVKPQNPVMNEDKKEIKHSETDINPVNKNDGIVE